MPVRGRPFARGQSGNPRGRPRRGAAVADFLRYELARPTGEDGKATRAQELARVLVAKALDGDVAAIRTVLERVDGKVPEPLMLPGRVAPVLFTLKLGERDDDGD
ncbi:MAG TPA: DUF5681 domain-containing protein [Dehalococcoidia bacterium]|nr:DUF5681 domain-containing protein [Dehalococcoidia bacterium]